MFVAAALVYAMVAVGILAVMAVWRGARAVRRWRVRRAMRALMAELNDHRRVYGDHGKRTRK